MDPVREALRGRHGRFRVPRRPGRKLYDEFWPPALCRRFPSARAFRTCSLKTEQRTKKPVRAITATGLPRAHSRFGLPSREWGEGTSRDRSPSNSGQTLFGGGHGAVRKNQSTSRFREVSPSLSDFSLIESFRVTPSGGAGDEHGFDGEFDPGSGRTLAACLTHASRAGSIQ